ncbi:endonuclease/exonuclease/phosphatase family protein [Mycobacterium sp. NPDC051804]|uniref:endonuclease/exonuclease/phosphatase family protein n=1 Tax=Mycobacterium sp. NPDC051804 TaxID=3364295 RepID=UPI00379175A4
MRLLRRRRRVTVRRFDPTTGTWLDANDVQAADRDELTVATFNIWFDDYYAEQRYRAIADLLRERRPDVIVLQEVTSVALEIFLSQPWIRDEYLTASAVGGRSGNYGLLTLSRVPIVRATHCHLPTRQTRGFLEAELAVVGARQVVCCVHLDSGKSSARLRGWQLRRIFRALRPAENAVVLGDFNMRDAENERIAAPFCDVWHALRPDDPGYTENTSINLMRFDARNKKRHVRFDRVLLKGNRWRAASIELLGTEPISAELPRVFPSDHFGVECRLVAHR